MTNVNSNDEDIWKQIQQTFNQIKQDTGIEPEEDYIKELEDSFYTQLEFGTGGIRGLMGVGTNRMNIYTVGFATQGFATYLKKSFQQNISVAIAHDSRNNGRLFPIG